MGICNTCSNGVSCSTCKNGGSTSNCTIAEDNCTDWKGMNYFYNPDSSECVACEPECATCLSTGRNCKTCNGLRLNAPLCTCPFACLSDDDCSSDGYCTKCRGTRVGPPLCRCPVRFYDDLVQDDCQPCMAQCLTCQNAYQCLTCPEGSLLNSGTKHCDCTTPAPSFAEAFGQCVTCGN